MPDITSTIEAPQGAQLDSSPPQPPGSRRSKSVMDLATKSDNETGLGQEAANPVVQILMAMGQSKNALQKLSAQLPILTPGIQQFIQGLEQVVPQMLSDLVSGQPPGSGSPGGPPSPMSSQGAPGAQTQAPGAPAPPTAAS